MQLFFRKLDNVSVKFARPFELCFLQALVPEAEPGLIPIHHLHLVALFVTEQEQGIGIGRQCHLAFNDQHQAIDGFTEVDGLTV